MRREFLLVLALIPVILIPILGFTWLIFSIYLLASCCGNRLRDMVRRTQVNSHILFFILALLSGFAVEILAIIDNLPKPPEERILLNPDPIIDMYLATAYYSAFAIAWDLALHRVNFTHREVFIIAGSFGIIFEQTGAILLSMNPFIWLYVFLVYGSYQALAP